MLVAAELMGSNGPGGVGIGPTAELLITGDDPDDGFLGHFDVMFRCDLPSGRSLQPEAQDLSTAANGGRGLGTHSVG